MGRPSPPRQRGVALLLLVFLTAIVATSIFLTAWNSSAGRQRQEQITYRALQLAKDALIGWSVSGASGPGVMPCPENTAAIGSALEGSAQSSCTAAAPLIGRLPWRTLKSGSLMDGSGEQLWYVLSPGFRSPPINANSIGHLQVDGVANAAVALIIAPGAPLPGQTRSVPSAGNPPLAANYLDLANAGGNAFVTSGTAGTFNDRIVVITQTELAKAMVRRVLGEVAGGATTNGLLRYYNDYGQFPWADANGDGFADASQTTGTLPFASLSFDSTTANWLNGNGWPSLVGYSRITASTAQIILSGQVMKVVP